MPPHRRRLREIAVAKGDSLAQLSAIRGRESAYIQQHIERRNPKRLHEDERRRLAIYFNVDERELEIGQAVERQNGEATVHLNISTKEIHGSRTGF